jgi:hypothetical protein
MRSGAIRAQRPQGTSDNFWTKQHVRGDFQIQDANCIHYPAEANGTDLTAIGE